MVMVNKSQTNKQIHLFAISNKKKKFPFRMRKGKVNLKKKTTSNGI